MIPTPQGGPRGAAIRRATVADAGDLAVFHVARWREAYRGIIPDAFLAHLDEREQTERWRKRLTAGRRDVALAIGDESSGHAPAPPILGIVAWGISHDPPEPSLPPLELASLYVAADRWASGLGELLLRVALCGSPAHLWVFEENRRARTFYAKHGFVPDGVRKVEEETGIWECRMVRR